MVSAYTYISLSYVSESLSSSATPSYEASSFKKLGSCTDAFGFGSRRAGWLVGRTSKRYWLSVFMRETIGGLCWFTARIRLYWMKRSL